MKSRRITSILSYELGAGGLEYCTWLDQKGELGLTIGEFKRDGTRGAHMEALLRRAIREGALVKEA